jgi:GT2 family glycosyltransferase
MAGPAEVTVSIVNHSNRELLLECLAALREHAAGLPVEIVVLDNASDDGSVEAVRAAFPHVRVIAQGHRAGFAANHNAVIAATEAPYVFVLNDDAMVTPGCLELLLGELRSDPSVGAVAPRIVSPDGTRQQTAWRFPTPAASVLFAASLGRLGIVQSDVEHAASVDSVSGCAVLLRREALDSAGAFDDGFFMYLEDMDLCLRLARSGYSTRLVPGATVVHHSGQSTSGASDARVNEYWRSRERYWHKHHGRAGALVARWATGAGYALLALAALLARRLPERVRPARAAHWSPAEYRQNARAAFRGPAGPGLRELAEDWNRRNAATPVPARGTASA